MLWFRKETDAMIKRLPPALSAFAHSMIAAFGFSLITAVGLSMASSAAPAVVRSAVTGSGATKGAPVRVTTVDFLSCAGVTANGAGPLLMQADAFRNRLILANTISSSVSIIDCRDNRVEVIPLEGRALQHLKAEALTYRRKTGDVYLIGARSFSIVSPEQKRARTIPTDVQFESIAVDEATGNVFVAGRESKELGFYAVKSKRLTLLPWLETREELANVNATPPPPIRKVLAAPELGWIVAVDGYTSTFFVFDGKRGSLLNHRALALTSGGRWHLAGYNEENHSLYLVVETNDRRVIEAAKVNVTTGEGIVVPLPQFTEGVGITYNPARDEVYIPYDNHASVHVVDFARGGTVEEIKIPAYGNDASAIDSKRGLLYVTSWAHGEVDVVDLASRKLLKRITGLGIIPHMFSMTFNPENGLIYFLKGASAVNGTFGAAVTSLDPGSETVKKIYTGWAPIAMVAVPSRNSFFVFNSEDRFAEVHPDGRYEIHSLPFDYPIEAVLNPDGDVYLSYGPHQSYWPVVYIWGAKDGILTVGAKDLGFYDRRIPRQAHRMAFDTTGTLYFTQNIWGKEQQFLGTLGDEVRLFDIGARVALEDTVERETAERIVRSDPSLNRLYHVRVGERDADPSVLEIVDAGTKKVVGKLPVGLTATDLAFDDTSIYVANFDSRSVSAIGATSFEVRQVPADDEPLKLCRCGSAVFVINHRGNSLQEVKEGAAVYRLPWDGLPDNLFAWNGDLIVTSHSQRSLFIVRFDPETKKFTLLHRFDYPYGDTSFDSANVSFYMRGQFADAIFSITHGETDAAGRLWVSDLLSGKLFILSAD
jgi:DNA-binding beta-propeller fold protein YncE